MYQTDPMSSKPIYEQIVEQTERFILSGALMPGEQLPSVRSLSVQLSLNPKTIQKAFLELDSLGVIQTTQGKGCFVSENAINILTYEKRKKLDTLFSTICEFRLAGVLKEEIIACVEKAYENK